MINVTFPMINTSFLLMSAPHKVVTQPAIKHAEEEKKIPEESLTQDPGTVDRKSLNKTQTNSTNQDMSLL